MNRRPTPESITINHRTKEEGKNTQLEEVERLVREYPHEGHLQVHLERVRGDRK